MLNKGTCQKCWGDGWTLEDSVRWEQRRYILCDRVPYKADTKLDIRTRPPKRCPYKFEHAVAEGVYAK